MNIAVVNLLYTADVRRGQLKDDRHYRDGERDEGRHAEDNVLERAYHSLLINQNKGILHKK